MTDKHEDRRDYGEQKISRPLLTIIALGDGRILTADSPRELLLDVLNEAIHARLALELAEVKAIASWAFKNRRNQ